MALLKHFMRLKGFRRTVVLLASVDAERARWPAVAIQYRRYARSLAIYPNDNAVNFFKLDIEVAAGVTDVINLFGHGCHGAL